MCIQTPADRLARMRKGFILSLATYFTTNVGHKSIMLQMQKQEGIDWATLVQSTPVNGNDPIDKAKEILTEFLLPDVELQKKVERYEEALEYLQQYPMDPGTVSDIIRKVLDGDTVKKAEEATQ